MNNIQGNIDGNLWAATEHVTAKYVEGGWIIDYPVYYLPVKSCSYPTPDQHRQRLGKNRIDFVSKPLADVKGHITDKIDEFLIRRYQGK